MKKAINSILSIVLLFVFSACGGSSSEALDALAPSTPTLTSSVLSSTIDNNTTIEVNGEVGAKVFVNAVEVGTVGADGKVSVPLTLSLGDNSFTITLRDTQGNESEALSFSVTRNEPARPFITTWKTDNTDSNDKKTISIATKGSGCAKKA